MKHWHYTNTKNSTTGIMICMQCQKPITDGDYRYFETEEAFVNMHRKCTSGNNGWAKYDADNAARRDALSKRLSEYRAFAEKWETAILDDEICQMESDLANTQDQPTPHQSHE